MEPLPDFALRFLVFDLENVFLTFSFEKPISIFSAFSQDLKLAFDFTCRRLLPSLMLSPIVRTQLASSLGYGANKLDENTRINESSMR